MQRRPSSQATSTLGNTPNLYIVSYTGNTIAAVEIFPNVHIKSGDTLYIDLNNNFSHNLHNIA